MNDMFTLDFSKKIIICANSEEELNKQYSEIAQARIESKQQFIECKIYTAIKSPAFLVSSVLNLSQQQSILNLSPATVTLGLFPCSRQRHDSSFRLTLE